jgi:hypothetical protein
MHCIVETAMWDLPWGFASIKDVVEVLLIPMLGGAIAFFWPKLQARSRRRRFRALIKRELEEIRPYPGQPQTAWHEQQKKNFLHKQIFENASENRDFILSLKPNMAYHASQLWQALRDKNSTQWLFHLDCLSKLFPRNREIRNRHDEWARLIQIQKNTRRQ